MSVLYIFIYLRGDSETSQFFFRIIISKERIRMNDTNTPKQWDGIHIVSYFLLMYEVHFMNKKFTPCLNFRF